MIRGAALLLAVLCAGSGPGAFAADERGCDSADFTTSPAPAPQLATVRSGAGARVHFFRGGGSCPEGPAAECRQKAYLVPGDSVAVAQHRTGFACAWYQRSNVNDAIVGWLPVKALEETKPPSSPPLAAWVREWTRFVASGNEATIQITRDPDGRSLRVAGEAQWMSSGMKDSGPNLAEVSGVGRPEGNRLVIHGEGDCVLELYLLDTGSLFVRDGFRCGGMNVTFSGLY
jgi:hypothetical protein